ALLFLEERRGRGYVVVWKLALFRLGTTAVADLEHLHRRLQGPQDMVRAAASLLHHDDPPVLFAGLFVRRPAGRAWTHFLSAGRIPDGMPCRSCRRLGRHFHPPAEAGMEQGKMTAPPI